MVFFSYSLTRSSQSTGAPNLSIWRGIICPILLHSLSDIDITNNNDEARDIKPFSSFVDRLVLHLHLNEHYLLLQTTIEWIHLGFMDKQNLSAPISSTTTFIWSCPQSWHEIKGPLPTLVIGQLHSLQTGYWSTWLKWSLSWNNS